MLSKFEIKKNKLDLLYQRQLQKYNSLMIFISGGVIGLLTTAIIVPNYFWLIIILSLGIITIGLFYYFKIMKPEMQNILNELTQMENILKN